MGNAAWIPQMKFNTAHVWSVKSWLGNWIWFKQTFSPNTASTDCQSIIYNMKKVTASRKYCNSHAFRKKKQSIGYLYKMQIIFISWRSNYSACFQIVVVIFCTPTLMQICWAFVATLCTCLERSSQENFCSWCCIKSTSCSTNRCFLSSCRCFTPCDPGKND